MDLGKLIENARLPSPSPVVLSLYDAIESGGAEELALLLEADAGLTARLLRLANSAFYGARRVATVREAIVRVGTLEVVALVLSTEVMRVFHGIAKAQFGLQSFWEHSLCTACYSRVLARHARLRIPAQLWVGGLLHDVGKLLLARHVPADYARVLRSTRAGTPLLQAERDCLGFTHAHAGAELLRRWRLPPLLVACAAAHHEAYPDLASAEAVVAAANRLANEETPSHSLPGVSAEEGQRIAAEAAGMYETYRKLFAEYLP